MSEAIAAAPANTQASGEAQPAAVAAPVAAPAPAAVDTSAAPAAAKQSTDGQPVAAPAAAADPNSAPAPQGAPEKYEFKAPEGNVFDDAIIAEYSTVAKELGLSQVDAQKVIDKLAPKIAERTTAANTEAFNAFKDGLATQAKVDKEFGGEKFNENLAVANKALEAYGTPELRKLLDASGLGNHPEIIRAFLKVGKTISEDKFVPGGLQPTKGEKSAANALYPNQKTA